MRQLIERLSDVVVHSADCAGRGRGDEHCTCDAVAVLLDVRGRLKAGDECLQALKNIAEGNLGDSAWQANYDKIRRVAWEAVAKAEGRPFAPDLRRALKDIYEAYLVDSSHLARLLHEIPDLVAHAEGDRS